MADSVALPEGFVVDDGGINMGEGLDRSGLMRVSTETQAARDRKAAQLRATYDSNPAYEGGAELPHIEQSVAAKAGSRPALAKRLPKLEATEVLPAGFVPDALPDGFEVEKRPTPEEMVANAGLKDSAVLDLLGRQKALPVLIGQAAGFIDRYLTISKELLTPDKDGVTPLERETARRKAAGGDAGPVAMQDWLSREARRKIFNKADEPDIDPLEYGKQMVKGMIEKPLETAKGFVEYAIAHPELLMMGPIAGLATIAGEQLVEQATERTSIDAKKLLVDTGLNAVPILAIHAAVRGAGLLAAKERGATPTAEAEAAALKAINEQVKEQVAEGADATAAAAGALDNVLQHMEIKPEERAAIIEGVKDASAEGKQPQGRESEHPGTEGERVSAEAVGGDRPVELAQSPKEGGEPGKVSTELRRLQDYERRVQTEVEGLTGEPKYEALRETAGKIAALQEGKVDPKVLALMALPGVGAAAGYWLGTDQSDAIRKAVIGGGLGLGAAMLGKTAGAVSRTFDGLKDTRYRITHLTDDYGRGVALGELGAFRLASALNAILPDVKLREQVLHAVQAGDLSGLSPAQLKYAEVLRKAFDNGGEMGQAAGILPENLLKDYVTQLWVRGLNTKDSLLENLKKSMSASAQASPGMSPKTRFAKQRSIPNYKAGIEAGLIPVTLDPSAIVQVYLTNINKAIQNQKLIAALKNEKNNLGEPIIAGNEALSAEVTRRATRDLEEVPIDPAAKKMTADIMGIKAPGDYVFINHPQMANVKVHPDVVAPLKALFDSADANAATRAALGLSIAAKRGIFSFSLFHAKSLMDALAGTSPRGWAKVPSALKALREGGIPALDDLVGAGLKVVQRPLEADASAFSNAMRVLEAKNPMVAMPAKGIRWVQEHMDQFLWGVVHPSFKVATALAAYEKGLRNPKLTKEQAAKAAVSYTNDIFGGLDWFKIADGVQNKYGRDLALGLASPSGRRFMQIAMLAPDWTVSTTRAMAKALPGVTSKEIAALHRGYVFRSALVYLAIANGLNQAFSGHNLWENRDPTMVDMGDGRRMQLSKHFMEPVHWLTKPGQQLMNKFGYLPKEIMTQATNQQYMKASGQAPPIVEAQMGFAEGLGARAKHAIKGMLPIPGTVAAEQGAGPAISGMLGVPIYGKTEQQAVDAAVERALRVYPEQPKKAVQAEKRTRKQYDKQRKEQEQRQR